MIRSIMIKQLVFILLLMCPTWLNAQFYNGYKMSFGKNRIQHNEERIWSQFRFPDFDFIFYQEGRKITINAARYAGNALNDISQKLGYKPERKIHFVVFNTLSELKSSNIGLDNELLYNTGGIAQVVDNKVILYFDGNYLNLERQIRSGIARVIIMQMLYGESLSANIKNSTLLALPDWYVNGLVSYLSEDWNNNLDESLRNGILYRRFDRFNTLEGADATLAGHSIWKFVADRYGMNMIPNVIYMTKVSRSVESGFLFVLGTSFKNVVSEWFNYHKSIYTSDITSGQTVPEHNAPLKIKKKNVYYQAKISPDGNSFTYVLDKFNKKKLFLTDLNSGKRKKLYRIGTKLEDTPDMTFPVTAWHPSSEIFSWVVEKKGRRVLYLYNVKDKSREEIFIDNLNKVLDIAYAPDGSSMVISAVVNGYSDIFLFYPGSKAVKRITYDVFDDLQPRFINNGKMIAFASDRVSDSLVLETETYIVDYSLAPVKQQSFDIFAYDISSGSPWLRRITNTPLVNEYAPKPFTQQSFCYLSDEGGITNLFEASFDSAIAYVDTSIHYRYFAKIKQVTNYNSSVRDVNFSDDFEKTILTFTVGKKSRIVLGETNNLFSEISTEKPVQTAYANYRNTTGGITNTPVDTFSHANNRRQGFVSPKPDSSGVNIYNYRFTVSSNSNGKANATQSKADTSKPLAFSLPHQQNYDVEYSIDKLTTQIDFSFLSPSYRPYSGFGPVMDNAGTSGLIQMGVTDLLEDRRITGGMNLSFSLDNNEYLLSYEDLSRRLDQQVVFHRASSEVLSPEASCLLKQHLHDLAYVVKWPFSPVLAIKGSVLFKYNQQVYKSIDDVSLETPDNNSYWAGTLVELVFDNTRSPMKNIYYGLRYKIFGEFYQGLHNNKLNLITAGLDFRLYSRIHRTFIWANRFAMGTSFGSSRLLYYLGGTDNTLFPAFKANNPVDTSMNFAFQTNATNLRGFPQNIRNGNTFAVINSELRFPVIRYLLNRPIKSQILNNFQIVGFTDIGSAWLGLNPYDERNVMVPEIYYQKPILVTIKYPRNPIVGGVGLGLRTLIANYFVRFDVAWGVQEMSVTKPRYIISFSLDF